MPTALFDRDARRQSARTSCGTTVVAFTRIAL
jgi:hypothetical protein